ncbi:hypothetical protein DFH09DRAFT_1245975 [Mycena vulgaris]|nr:hypothetical protein DFH09DRAFT_1245975 [Mycena vulgaris]
MVNTPVGNDSSEDEEDPTDDSSLDGEFYVEDITADPLFRSRSSLFDDFQPDKTAVDEIPVPWAFDDHPAIRHTYIRAFVGAAFKGMTRDAVVNMLDGAHTVFRSAAASGVDFPGLSNFARTLSTVEKRLGVCTDQLITYLFLCDVCWKPHYPQELATLDKPTCDQPDCSGRLYTVKRLSSGAEKRTPVLSLPFVAPEKPGKVAQWREWRGAGDAPGKREPSILKAGLQRRRNGLWEVQDVDVSNLKQQFVALPNDLVLQINVDWFQAVKGPCHSTGAFYGTVCNNPRRIRFLREETMLLMVFPGPHEPTSEQYNNVMTIPVRHFKKLYNGVLFDVHNKPEPEPFHVQIGSDVSDLPASRKTSGVVTFTSKYFMCDHCDTPFYALVDPDAFNSSKFNERDPWRYLKYAFRARDASAEVAEEITRRRGVRHSVMNGLVNWLPGVTGLFDLMHCIFGTAQKIEDFFKNLIWPPSISRLPPSVRLVARGAGSIKADQWRSQITVFFVGLFLAWQVDGEIPDIDAEPSADKTKNAAAQAAQEKLVRARMRENLLAKNPDATEDDLEHIKTVKMDRSLRRHYEAVVQFTAAVRIITSNSISPNEVKRGCRTLETAIQSWARMHCHLVPYFHYAVHLEPQYLKHGPGPNWWTYPYERNNGFLGRFNHNGHSGGEMEGTMMRGWWKTMMIQDLSIKNPGFEDRDSLELLKSCLKGDASERKGTLQNYIARVQAERNPNPIDFPRYSKPAVLRELGPGYYGLVFDYLKDLWRSKAVLIPDVELTQNGDQLSFSGDVESFSHLWVHKRRYGAASQHRGKSAQYSLHGWATDIGVSVWQAEVLGPAQVISLHQLSGHFVLAPVTICGKHLWITIAHDHDATESDVVNDDDTTE